MRLQKVEGIFVTLWQQQHQFQDVKYQIPICRMCVIYILLTLQESRGKKNPKQIILLVKSSLLQLIKKTNGIANLPFGSTVLSPSRRITVGSKI